MSRLPVELGFEFGLLLSRAVARRLQFGQKAAFDVTPCLHRFGKPPFGLFLGRRSGGTLKDEISFALRELVGRGCGLLLSVPERRMTDRKLMLESLARG